MIYLLDKLIKSSTTYLINANAIKEDDRDIYEYGFHAFYSNVLDVVSIVILSIWLKQIPQTIVYHIAFVIMRSVAGGFHAKTRIRCFVISTFVWLISLWAINNFINTLSYLFLSGISVLIVWIFAPIEHYNSPLSESKYIKMKLKSRVFSSILFITVCLLSLIPRDNTWIASSITYGMTSHSVLIMLTLLRINEK